MGQVLQFPRRSPEPTVWTLLGAMVSGVFSVFAGWRAPTPPTSEMDEARERHAAAQVDAALHDERRRIGVEE